MKYKIIEILKTFSENEIRQFECFLESPFFNESLKLRKFYSSLLRHYPDFNTESMCEEKLSFEINPNLPYNKSTIKTLFFDLANCAEEFMKINVFKKKKAEAEDFLREDYARRKLYKYAEQNARKMLSTIDNESNFSSGYFYNRHCILTDIFNCLKVNSNNSSPEFLKNLSEILNERGKCLTYLFLEEMLFQYNMLLTLKKTFKITEENNYIIKLFNKIDFDEFLEFIIPETDNECCSLIFELNLANYRAFKDFENEENYHQFKSLLVKNLNKLNNDQIYVNFIRLIRYCMMKPLESQSGFDFRSELFNIYKFILSKKYYVMGVHDFLPVELYRTVLKLGLELKKFKWTLEFIKRYKDELRENVRENMFNFSLAEYYFHKKRFDMAMRYFHKLELNHFMLRVDLRNLMLMTYYELDLYENAISLIDSYKHFLSNTDMLSDLEKSKCKYFIKAVQYMIKYKTSGKPISKLEIEKILSEDFHNKSWAKERFLMIDNRFTKSA